MPKKTLKQKYSARLCSNPPKKMTAHQKKLFKKYCKSDSDSDSDFDYDENEEIPLHDLHDLFDDDSFPGSDESDEIEEIPLNDSSVRGSEDISTFQQQIAQNIIKTEAEDKQIEKLEKKAKIIESYNVANASESTQSEIQLHPTIVAIQEKSTPKKTSFLDSLANKLSPSKEEVQQRW